MSDCIRSRNTAVDAYRVFLMFGICVLHAASQGGHNLPWLANSLEWCVTGFVFISGWFGIRFDVFKVLRLFWTSLYCALVFSIFDAMCNGGVVSLKDIWEITTHQWFLNAYVVLMCFAPLMNIACEFISRQVESVGWRALQSAAPLLFCVFVWSFARTLPYVSQYAPNTPGLGGYTFLMMIGVYIVGRILNLLSQSRVGIYGSLRLWWKVLVVSLPIAALGLGDYNSPFAIAIAISVFFIFKRYEPSLFLGRLLVFLGPSMFSIYLLHSHGRAWRYFEMLENVGFENNIPPVCVFLLTAIFVFVFCLALDMPRRASEAVCRKIRGGGI